MMMMMIFYGQKFSIAAFKKAKIDEVDKIVYIMKRKAQTYN